MVSSDDTYNVVSRINVSSKLEVTPKELDKLKFLNLGLTGKVLLINSVIHSQLYYLSGVQRRIEF